MNDWALIAVVGILVAYKLLDRWIDSRASDAGETPPPGNDTLIETPYRDPARDDGRRRIPDIQLGFQREEWQLGGRSDADITVISQDEIEDGED